MARTCGYPSASPGFTIQFVTDPRVFSMIVGEISEALYEFLCNEGFLDLPPDWRQAAPAS